VKIELNIGLDVKGSANTQTQRTERARKALDIIRAAGLRYQVERLASQYEDNDGVAHLEDTLVVEVDVPPIGGERTINALAYQICIEIEQECIAVYNYVRQRGELIGPNASSWGSFDINFFRFYSEAALPRAA